VQKEYINDPKLKYPMLRESKRLHAFFSPDEWNRLIEKVSYKLALKRILLGRLTGMRPKELAYLAWDDIDIELKQIKIQSKKNLFQIKTDEERIIPLSQEAIEILNSIPKISRWVFSRSKKPVLDIRKALKTAARKAGIKKTVTPGMLRHTFCTHALMKGADIQALQAILGHKSLETTTKYTHALKESMQKTVELLSK
jgi:integrase